MDNRIFENEPVSNSLSAVVRFLSLCLRGLLPMGVLSGVFLSNSDSALAAPKVSIQLCSQVFEANPAAQYLAEIKEKDLLVPMREEYRGEPDRDYVRDDELAQLEIVVVYDKKHGARLFSPYYNEFVDTGSYRPSSASDEIAYNYTDFVIDSEGRFLLGMYLEGRDVWVNGIRPLRGHSVLARGKPVVAAGSAAIINGKIEEVRNWTGHYGDKIEVNLMRGIRYLRLKRLKIKPNQIFDYTGVRR